MRFVSIMFLLLIFNNFIDNLYSHIIIFFSFVVSSKCVFIPVRIKYNSIHKISTLNSNFNLIKKYRLNSPKTNRGKFNPWAHLVPIFRGHFYNAAFVIRNIPEFSGLSRFESDRGWSMGGFVYEGWLNLMVCGADFDRQRWLWIELWIWFNGYWFL